MNSDHIPINFTFQGKNWQCYFSPVSGAGSTSTWHLMEGKYYIGQLIITDRSIWQFSSNAYEDMKELSEFFGDHVMAWYQ